jgi:hypothetical protein
MRATLAAPGMGPRLGEGSGDLRRSARRARPRSAGDLAGSSSAMGFDHGNAERGMGERENKGIYPSAQDERRSAKQVRRRRCSLYERSSGTGLAQGRKGTKAWGRG